MYRYKLHYEDGSEAGEAAYADWVREGDELHLGPGNKVRVLDLVLIDEEEDSPYVGAVEGRAGLMYGSARCVLGVGGYDQIMAKPGGPVPIVRSTGSPKR